MLLRACVRHGLASQAFALGIPSIAPISPLNGVVDGALLRIECRLRAEHSCRAAPKWGSHNGLILVQVYNLEVDNSRGCETGG